MGCDWIDVMKDLQHTIAAIAAIALPNQLDFLNKCSLPEAFTQKKQGYTLFV